MTKMEQIAKMRADAAALEAQGKKDQAKQLLSDATTLEAQELQMDDKAPKLRMCKMTAGPRKGMRGLFTSEGKPVGYIDGESDDDADDKKKMSDAIKEFKELGFAEMKLTDIRDLVERGKAAIAADAKGDGVRVLLTEAVKDGVLDMTLASFVANKHRGVTTDDFITVSRANQILASAVDKGKLPPAHRAQLFEDVARNPEKWEKLFSSSVPLFSVGRGIGNPGDTDGSPITPAQKVDVSTKKYLQEHAGEKLDYAQAMRIVLREDPTLAKEYEASRSVMKG